MVTNSQTNNVLPLVAVFFELGGELYLYIKVMVYPLLYHNS